jgi:hypothetical protein
MSRRYIPEPTARELDVEGVRVVVVAIGWA